MEVARKTRTVEAGIVGSDGAEMGERQSCVSSRLRLLGKGEKWLGGQPSHRDPKYTARTGRTS